MSVKIPGFLRRTEVHVEDYLGQTGKGASYGPERVLEVRKEDRRRILREKGSTEISISSVTLALDPEQDIPEGSRVTLPDGRELVAREIISPEFLSGPAYREVLLG